MLACDQTITLARTDGTAWTVETVSGVSWYDKAQAQTMERGLKKNRSTTIRIPAAVVPSLFPQVGDLVILGSVASIGSIKDLSGETYCTVLTVADNRRQCISDRLRHVCLTCE